MITITTDFSSREHYAGVLKGVIKSYGNIDVVDITHDIDPFDILHGAYILLNIIGYFPPDTIHVMVIDPGVGTSRKGVLARLERGYFVGPNNGLLTFVRDMVRDIYEIIVPSDASRTFHGRDVFVPVAAKLAMGKWPENLKKISKDSIISLNIRPPQLVKNAIMATIIHIDSFGNVITNIPDNFVKFTPGEEIFLNYHGIHKCIFRETYEEGKEGELIMLINSENFLEISMNKGRASNFLKANKMDEIMIELP
ncbi:MAG: SAM-dependent chlorinase/fluorinase [Thermoplasmata archaeon]|nr:SAM-dependent chlorinase/fluorinase [Thermoplasmata archaeon]